MSLRETVQVNGPSRKTWVPLLIHRGLKYHPSCRQINNDCISRVTGIKGLEMLISIIVTGSTTPGIRGRRLGTLARN